MEKAENKTAVTLRKLFFISITAFLLFYMRWFWLIPSNTFLLFGILWLIFHITIAIIFRIRNDQTVLDISLFLFAPIFVANLAIISFNYPKVVDSGIYNGALYYLVSNPNYDTAYSPDDYDLTKWYGFLQFESHHVYFRTDRLRLFYDSNMKLVNVVSYSDEDGSEWLLYANSAPPRYYQHTAASKNHRFYISVGDTSAATDMFGNRRVYYHYTIYECELDNTGCAPIPFKFTSEEEWTTLEFNEATQEIEFYIWPDNEDLTLVYSYGDHPRCHVEGCEILQP